MIEITLGLKIWILAMLFSCFAGSALSMPNLFICHSTDSLNTANYSTSSQKGFAKVLLNIVPEASTVGWGRTYSVRSNPSARGKDIEIINDEISGSWIAIMNSTETMYDRMTVTYSFWIPEMSSATADSLFFASQLIRTENYLSILGSVNGPKSKSEVVSQLECEASKIEF